MNQMENHFWEENIYSKGLHLNKYPYDNVVSFVFRHYPRQMARKDVKILEVGSGAGNNLWFAAREGFDVTGLDISPSAISFCKKRFLEDNLQGKFIVGNFVSLPFESSSFDLVIDRGSLTCCGLTDVVTAVEEIARVLKKNGKFFFNGFSKQHTSFKQGSQNPDGTWSNIKKGTLAGIEHIYFFDEMEIDTIFPSSQWKIVTKNHKLHQEMLSSNIHAEWEVIAETI
jgi:ubiquinone/menaquinone biosynthesis C-methylase UbiE